MNENTTIRDDLARDRTVLANDRTLLAYVRTALALIGVGLIFFKLDPSTESAVTAVLMFVGGMGVFLWGLRSYQHMVVKLNPEHELAREHATASFDE
jgi:putative membrane protein